jgi:hypothetical protein
MGGPICAHAQEAEIVLGNTQLARNQAFTITLKVHSAQVKNRAAFPEIVGLSKAGISTRNSVEELKGNLARPSRK